MADERDYYYLNNLIFHGEGYISLDYDISLKKGDIDIKKDNLTIDGNGHTIDANGKTRIFNVSGRNVVLKNFIFKNGKAPTGFRAKAQGYGGAIRNEGQLELNNCQFINNVAKKEGNDIINNSELTIINCKFSKTDNGKNAIFNRSLIMALGSEQNELEPFISNDNVKWIFNGSVDPEVVGDPTDNEYNSIMGLKESEDNETDIVKSNIERHSEEKMSGESHASANPFKAYDGDGPFIFISYKHADTDLILPIIEKFHYRGYNVWFDHGLQYGEDYDDLIDFKIDGSSLFVIFITENVIKGAYNPDEYMKKELDVAIDTGTKIFPIFLDDVGLKGKYRMQLRGKHSIFLHEYDDVDEFIDDCVNAFKEDFGIDSSV